MRNSFKRVVLKLSGEVLGGGDFGFSENILDGITDEIKEIKRALSIDIAIVVGGGNIVRGSEAVKFGIDKTTGDYMGMIATILNALALQSVLESKHVPTVVMSAFEIKGIAEAYIRREAIRHLENGKVVIFAGGTGSPFFSTDTAGALRAVEIGADALLKGSKVDGIYDKDPYKHRDARKYERLTYDEVIVGNLKVMDATAIALCKEHRLPVIVFDITKRGNLRKLLMGENIGTFVG